MSKFIDWQVMRGSLITISLCLLISGGLVWGSIYFKDAVDQEFRRNNAVFQTNSNQYLAVDEEERMIEEYFPTFVNLYNNGEIGRERRLDWIESLRSAGVDLKLPSLNYSLSSQSAYFPDFPLTLGRYRIYKSEMALRIQLVHEGDLFALITDLEEKAKGSFRVTQCNIKNSIIENISENILVPNVVVDCMLEWFTLNMADGSEIKVES
jgi:hypothetical protein